MKDGILLNPVDPFTNLQKRNKIHKGFVCEMLEESVIVNINECFYKAVCLLKVKRDGPAGRRRGELCEQKLQPTATLNITA